MAKYLPVRSSRNQNGWMIPPLVSTTVQQDTWLQLCLTLIDAVYLQGRKCTFVRAKNNVPARTGLEKYLYPDWKSTCMSCCCRVVCGVCARQVNLTRQANRSWPTFNFYRHLQSHTNLKRLNLLGLATKISDCQEQDTYEELEFSEHSSLGFCPCQQQCRILCIQNLILLNKNRSLQLCLALTARSRNCLTRQVRRQTQEMVNNLIIIRQDLSKTKGKIGFSSGRIILLCKKGKTLLVLTYYFLQLHFLLFFHCFQYHCNS